MYVFIKLLLCSILLMTTMILNGQSLSVPVAGYKNNVGTALSTGIFIDKPAWFLGWGVDYSFVVGEKWIILAGLAYDQEHSTKSKSNEIPVHSFSPNLALGYILTPRFAIGAGIGKGLFDTDNSEGKLKYTNSGNLTIGLLGSYTVYSKNRHGIDLGWGVERGLINPETDITIELGYGYSF